jgi:hypothetical protein
MRKLILITSLLAFTAILWAHGGFEHVQGTVSKVSPTSVTVQTTAGKTVEVGLTAKTTYSRDNKKATAADMKVGDRVVIDATEEAKKLTAAEIKLGVAGKAATKASHDDHSDHSAHK